MWTRAGFLVLVVGFWSCGSSDLPNDVSRDSYVETVAGEDVPVADPGGSESRDGVEEISDSGQVDSTDALEVVGEDGGGDDSGASADGEVINPCGGCTGGMVCVGDQCQCPETLTDCLGVCKPLGTNMDCSECGDACPQGGSCEAGQCKCPGSQVDCLGVCTSLGTDTDCSGCGDACIGVKTCELGKCIAPVDPECLPTVPCVSNDDCPSGARCNHAIQPPTCQKLYCGGFGSACSDEWFCLSQACQDEVCVSDCSGLECGPDPVYGESCGTCETGATCQSGQCYCEPEGHKDCCDGNVCWIDSCGKRGAVIEGCPLACLNGACVECLEVGLKDCFGICKSLGTSDDCSDCGDVCPLGSSCIDSNCIKCTSFRTEWGPLGLVSALSIPHAKAVAESACFDFSGNGKGDSGLTGLAGQINPVFTERLNGGQLVALFEFPRDHFDYWNMLNTDLVGLAGLTEESGYQIDPVSFNGDCTPVNRFEAESYQGELTATSPSLFLGIPLFEESPSTTGIQLIDVRLLAQIVEAGPDGVVMQNGVLSAVITRDIVIHWINQREAECDVSPVGEEPSYCGYLDTMKQILPTLFDLHRTADGMYLPKDGTHAANAISVCLLFETTQASTLGVMQLARQVKL